MKKTIKKIKELTKGFSSLNIGEDTFQDPILLEHIGKDEEILIEQINELNVSCTKYIHGVEIESFTLPFENLSVNILKQVLSNILEANSYLETPER